ncbi:MAG TPA: CBS domain-containing protein [Candidatus Hydrogenedentes bacterium]|nr:CBS domain-containing protein [Candidatus Hydrogenedentota bacterium]HQH68141.1 CBS domain-containing protein [Candidatus Hydrogenedentota bacterium]HQK75550.1 CBS domain-containing protein [Candidatus Hydrogenedentota bacterium]HQM31176.1 CBS domain-containing protein [Candidatus Hydrogenedentota bacterium]
MVAVPVARDIMKTTIRVVHPDMSVLAAMHALHSKGENAAMVVDDDFRLVGILTEKDCLRILLHEMYDRFEEIGRALVADFMSPVVETLTPGMDLFAVASAFLRTNFTALPVVDEGVLAGAVYRLSMLAAIVDLVKREDAGHALFLEKIKMTEHPQSIQDLLRLTGEHSRQQLKEVFSHRYYPPPDTPP